MDMYDTVVVEVYFFSFLAFPPSHPMQWCTFFPLGKSGPAHVVTPGGTLPELQFKFREGWIEIVNGTPGVISLCGTYGPNMLRMDLSDISEASRIEMTQDPFMYVSYWDIVYCLYTK